MQQATILKPGSVKISPADCRDPHPTYSYLDLFGISHKDRTDGLKIGRQGLSLAQLNKFYKRTGFTRPEVEKIIGVSPSTMERRIREKCLRPEESDRLLKVAQIYDRMLVIRDGDAASVSRWFHTPNEFLGWSSPADTCQTELGRDRVQALVYRIIDGLY
jgi:putative toxin-antitoxin system antitoxin component (TIGR02293 family)